MFDEDFPNTILYVGDVRPGPVTVWRAVFIADVTPPEQRTGGMRDKAEGPLITVAREAFAVSDPKNNRIQLSMRDRAVHEMGKDSKANDSFSPSWDQALDAVAAGAQAAGLQRHEHAPVDALHRAGPD